MDTTNSKIENEQLDMNPIGLLQKKHAEPLHSHETYLLPEIQPHCAAAARGANPWTGQTADEVREAAFSEQQYQHSLSSKGQAISGMNSPKIETDPPVAP